MSTIEPEIWQRLIGEPIHGETLRARNAVPEVNERLLAALDASGCRHLLIQLHSEDLDLQDTQSRGLEISTRELIMGERGSGRYLDIVCQDPTGYEVFDLIGGELAERLSGERGTATEIVSRVFSKWRRFWGQSPKQLLSKDKQIGLFAEIWFLHVWLIPKIGALEAVARWRGQWGSRHDFEWKGYSVEVKATTLTRGRIHHINGLDQLIPPEHGDLFLFSMQLREEAGATNSLPILISACRTQLNDNKDALLLFNETLVEARYSYIHEEEYAKLRLRIVEEGLFAVRDDFPCISPATFSDGLPSGIEHIEYQINLNGFMHLCIASTPTEVNIL